MRARRVFAHPLALSLLAAAACTLPAAAHAQSAYTTLHHFQQGPGGIKGPLIQAADGNIYGTASEGGRYSGGLIYVMRRAANGSWLPPATLHDFQMPEGVKPLAGLTEGAPGILYGTTSEGGLRGGGTIFRVAVTGQFQVLRSLNPPLDGAKPKAELTKAPDGSFYGSASEGGTHNFGTAFRITQSGAFTRFLAFAGPNGRHPAGAMAFGPDGNLYGTTMEGGAFLFGTAFRMTPAGVLTTIHSFRPQTPGIPQGAVLPAGPLTLAWDGAFYGITTAEWFAAPDARFRGGLFRMTMSGAISSVIGLAGQTPSTAVTLGADGWLYGISASSTTIRFYRVWPFPQTLEWLPDPPINDPRILGTEPTAALLWDADGKLYGATQAWGPRGHGSLFSITTSGEQSGLHGFANDGFVPTGDLLRSADGSLYGLTGYGGLTDSGTVVRVSSPSTVSQLADIFGEFVSHAVGTPAELSNGHLLVSGPGGMTEILKTGERIDWTGLPANSGVVEAPDGFVYGSTNVEPPPGSIRRFGPGTFELLHAFQDTDGTEPLGGLMRASDGHIYGTTSAGGTFGHGTVFRFELPGTLTTLHHFSGPDGSVATANLIEGPDGFLYGTTLLGGDTTLVPQGGGTVFKVAKDGTGFTSLHAFTGSDGLLPFARLTLASDGLFYGTALTGGLGTGTVFVVNSEGGFAVVHRFGPGEGAHPLGGVTEWNGALFGTTAAGGTANVGVLYRLGG